MNIMIRRVFCENFSRRRLEAISQFDLNFQPKSVALHRLSLLSNLLQVIRGIEFDEGIHWMSSSHQSIYQLVLFRLRTAYLETPNQQAKQNEITANKTHIYYPQNSHNCVKS